MEALNLTLQGPKALLPNYQNTIIYIIKCKDDNIIKEYIGSTTNFKQRKNKHNYDCNNENSKNYNQFNQI